MTNTIKNKAKKYRKLITKIKEIDKTSHKKQSHKGNRNIYTERKQTSTEKMLKIQNNTDNLQKTHKNTDK